MRKEKLVGTYKYMIIKILFLFEILKFKNIFKKITMVEKKKFIKKIDSALYLSAIISP